MSRSIGQAFTLCLLVFFVSSGTPWADDCTAVSPGHWTGSLSETWHMAGTKSSVHSINAALSLDIACNGKVTGTVGPGRTKVTGAFDTPWGASPVNGKVETADDGKPVIRFEGLIGANGGSLHTISLYVALSSPGKMSGTRRWLDNALGAGPVEWSWSLTSTDVKDKDPDKKPPLILQFVPQLERVFMSGVPDVSGAYTATIDWQGEAPGSAAFTLDGQPQTGSASGTQATATVKIDALAPGSHTLAVTATSAGGQASANAQIKVVAAPQNAALKPEITPPRVVYRGDATLDDLAIGLIGHVQADVPLLNGLTGVFPSTFSVPIAAASNEPAEGAQFLAGDLNLVIADMVNANLKVLPPSAAQTVLTDQGMTLVNSSIAVVPVNVVNIPVPMEKAIPASAGIIKNPGPVLTIYTVTVTGNIVLGVRANKVTMTGGELTIKVDANVPIQEVFGGAQTWNVSGEGHETVKIEFDPAPHISQCFGTSTVTILAQSGGTQLIQPVQTGGFAACP